MNWLTFAVAMLLALGLELGLRPALERGDGIAPSFVIPLAVWAALAVPQRTAVWIGLAAGMLLDLTNRLATGTGATALLVGPYLIGAAAAMRVVVHLRGGVMRRHPVSLALLSIAAALTMHLVVLAIMTLRQAYDPLADWQPWSQAVNRFFSAALTGVVALLAAWPLQKIESLWDFHPERIRRR